MSTFGRAELNPDQYDCPTGQTWLFPGTGHFLSGLRCALFSGDPSSRVGWIRMWTLKTPSRGKTLLPGLSGSSAPWAQDPSAPKY